MEARREVFRARHDRFRNAVIGEPRGSDVLVGALLVPPSDASCIAGVVFFNNVGVLGMCGHGLIGLVATLRHLGRLPPGLHRFETAVGTVTATGHDDGSVSISSVPSQRKARAVAVSVPGIGIVTGDVAWGGNWFFLVHEPVEPLERGNVAALTDRALRIRHTVNAAGFPEVDHIELFGAPRTPGGCSRNFVLCPGGAYDRSPCGTGTSAKMACLAAEGRLVEGDAWVQEGILGTTFTGRFEWLDRGAGLIRPTLTGSAHVTAEATLLLHESDPFCWGIASEGCHPTPLQH